jgi:death on curing protein
LDSDNSHFLSEQTINDLHDDLLAQHGGLKGCNTQLLGTVVAYPQQKFAYDNPVPTIEALAAYYAFAAARFHAFSDGNKRVALASMELFLAQHGLELGASNDEKADVILALAADEIGEQDIVEWVLGCSGGLVLE